jgi:hypothetical protein
VHHLLARLKPIIVELEQNLERDGFSRPVEIAELVGLFSKHASREIEIFEVNFKLEKLSGLNVSFSDSRKTLIFTRPCEESHTFDPRCEQCRGLRFAITKELVHICDSESDKTPPAAIRAELLEGLVTFDFNRGGAVAEYEAELGAIELLAPYAHRRLSVGSLTEEMAKRTGDYEKLASQFAIPVKYAKLAFSDPYMEFVKEARRLNGLGG